MTMGSQNGEEQSFSQGDIRESPVRLRSCLYHDLLGTSTLCHSVFF